MFLVPEPHPVSSASPSLKDSKILYGLQPMSSLRSQVTLNEPEVHSFETAVHSFELALTSLILRSRGLRLPLSRTLSSQTTPNRGLFAPSHFEYDTGATVRLSRHLQSCYTRHQHRKRKSIQDINLAAQANSRAQTIQTNCLQGGIKSLAQFSAPRLSPACTRRPDKSQLHRSH
ncbi:hypothetical protein C8R45DRAFT_1046958 [Mycena sanguinolenta]|nr:hypothetical protein C8R45DRAFT_1046958 [Mycena sanguinolenta]